MIPVFLVIGALLELSHSAHEITKARTLWSKQCTEKYLTFEYKIEILQVEDEFNSIPSLSKE